MYLIIVARFSTGWHISLSQTSRWHQNRSSVLARPGRPGQAKTELLFWLKVCLNLMCHPVYQWKGMHQYLDSVWHLDIIHSMEWERKKRKGQSALEINNPTLVTFILLAFDLFEGAVCLSNANHGCLCEGSLWMSMRSSQIDKETKILDGPLLG